VDDHEYLSPDEAAVEDGELSILTAAAIASGDFMSNYMVCHAMPCLSMAI
jgi:hypothetical protein